MTDETGESTSVSKSIRLSEKAFSLSITCPTEGFKGDLDEVKVQALNAEGEEVEADVTLSLSRIPTPESYKRKRYWNMEVDAPLLTETQFEQLFPKDATDMDSENREASYESIFSGQPYSQDSKSILQNLDSGSYELTFTAVNDKGETVEEKRKIFISDRGTSALPTKALWTSRLDESYEPGDELTLELATPYESVAVLYRLQDNTGDRKIEWKSLPSDGIMRYTILDTDRGGFTLDLAVIKDNRMYGELFHVKVPWTNKKVDVEFVSFRDKLAPAEEETWTLIFKDVDGQPINGELLAGMYDASLDQFVTHQWSSSFFPRKQSYNTWRVFGFSDRTTSGLIRDRVNYYFNINGISPWLNWSGFNPNAYARSRRRAKRNTTSDGISIRGSRPEATVYYIDGIRVNADNAAAQVPQAQIESAGALDAVTVSGGADESNSNATSAPSDDFSLRENLNETVFFFPEVEIVDGQATLSFKMNEALTKWKLLLFAHNKDLKYVFGEKEVITQKELMIEPLLPRFVRQGDEIVLTSKLSNLTSESISAAAEIIIEDAITGRNLNSELGITRADIKELAAGTSKVVHWSLTLPEDYLNPLLIKTLVKGDGHADGEQNIVPVLTNRKLVTETMPMHVAGGETKSFDFEALDKLGGATLSPHNYSLEFTSNPSWIVAKAIPHLTIECNTTNTISYANAIYGNLLMQHLLKEQPSLKEAIKLWKDEDLTSELEKKSDLKLNELTETPWVRQALGESEQMRKLKIFLDDNYINQQVNTYFRKLKSRQLSNGGFSWMDGGRDNWYVTQNVLENIGHLQNLGVQVPFDKSLIDKAIQYCDARMIEYYEDNRSESKYLPPTVLNYLYVRSFFDKKVSGKLKKATKFYYEKGEASWTGMNTYQQGLLALAAHRSDRPTLASQILSSLEDRMIRNEELGAYWNDQAGYYWYNLNIEQQALMIEVFSEIKPNAKDLDDLRLFLLKSKQTNSWKTSKATAAACYAFLLGSENWLGGTEMVQVRYPQRTEVLPAIHTQRHTGYYRQDIESSKINQNLREVTVTNPNPGVAWGASYFQYFEDLDKITDFEDTPALIKKTLYKVNVADNGEVLVALTDEATLQPGYRVRIRIELTVDRPMEFMQMKDMRSSGLEPTNVLSQYKWQDGLGYYESTGDEASYFFFDRIAKGNYVFEYDVFAVHQGKFSNGITEFQSMYAPEFSSHSEGIQLEITKP